MELLPSTSINTIYAVLPLGCNAASDPSNCAATRGQFFDLSASSTWHEKGLYELDNLAKLSLGLTGSGEFGFDAAILGYQGGGGPSLNRTVVAGYETKDLYVGVLGLAPNAVNWTDYNHPEPSGMTHLKNEGYTESNSFGYTAGSFNRDQAGASLTFGGYDVLRFMPNNLTIDRGADITHDLLVTVQSITTESGSQSLLPEPIVAYIDSTIAQIWLPTEACQRFEGVYWAVLERGRQPVLCQRQRP